MNALANSSDSLRNVTNNVSSNVSDAASKFDLKQENINGIIPDLTLLSAMLLSLTSNRSSCSKSSDTFNDTYDYVIVGAGSAGAIVASRLSEVPCVRVLLLEAGGEPPALTEVPAYYPFFQNTPIDWNFKTTPQKYGAFSMDKKQVPIHGGKVLGGGSVINAMLYTRGNKQNYDDWEADGATGWSYKDVLPYFLKLEDNQNIDQLDPGYHRKGGPVTEEKPNYQSELKQPILDATAALGWNRVDSNGERETGIYDFELTVRNQQRCSSVKAYLDKSRCRPNLDILTFAYATKILIEKRPQGQSRAYGVEFSRFNVTYTVRAEREVIISSGTILTPQILMLSGIGPKEELEKFNIDVIADLPVGKNLQDHCSGALTYNINNDSVTPILVKIANPVYIQDYITNRKGPLTSDLDIVLAFLDGVRTNSASKDFPRQQIYFVDFVNLNETAKPKSADEIKSGSVQPIKPALLCASSLLQPYSRGEVTLNSTDPFDPPNINPNYYQDRRDVRDVVKGLRACEAVANHPAMQHLQPELVKDEFSACEKFYNRSMNRFYACVSRQKIISIYHLVGTARMGASNDSRSVVDPELRVIGVKNLRVVSGAVIPIVPSANTNIPIMMVAEKASDIIKRDIQC